MTKTHTKTEQITDAELAELDRLRGETPPLPYYFSMDPLNPNHWKNEMWSNPEPNPHILIFNVYHPQAIELAEFVTRLCNAYPALRARLDAAEREREELRAEVDSVRNVSAKWLAENNPRMKCEGAAENLNEMADGGLNWDAVTLRREAEAVLMDAAKRLREGGE